MLVDTHAHLTSKDHIEKIIEEAKENGVEKIILAGTNLKDSLENIELAKKYEELYAAVGIYPHEEIGKPIEYLLKSLSEIFTQKNNLNKIVAMGECGLDYKENVRPREEQKELFRMQVGLSVEENLPLQIHSRNSYEEVLIELTRYKDIKNLGGVFHCFVGDLGTALKIIERGFYLSFNGIITYPSAKHLVEVIEKIPLENILLETDSPLLIPEPLRSRGAEKNCPKNVKMVASRIAEIKGFSLPEISDATTKNAERLFLI